MQSVERACSGNAGTVMPFKTHVATHSIKFIPLSYRFSIRIDFTWQTRIRSINKMGVRCECVYVISFIHILYYRI